MRRLVNSIKILLCSLLVLSVIVSNPLINVEAGNLELYKKRDASNPCSWQQHRMRDGMSNQIADSEGFPDNINNVVMLDGDNTLTTAGCSYFSLTYALLKHGDLTPNENTVKNVWTKIHDAGGDKGGASFGPVNWGKVTGIYTNISSCVRNDSAGLDSSNLASKAKSLMDDGNFVILLVSDASGKNRTDGHYLMIDKVVGNDVYIMDSFALENTWGRAYGGTGSILATVCIKFKDGKKPTECPSLIDKYWGSSSKSDSSSDENTITGYDYAEFAVKYSWDSVNQASPSGTDNYTNTGTPEYKEAHDKAFGASAIYASCDISTATAIVATGADPNLPQGNCSRQEGYLKATTDIWEYLGTNDDVKYEDLLPGDVFVNGNTHTMMYVGNELIKSVKGSTMDDTLDTVEGSITYNRTPHVSSSVGITYQRGYFAGLGGAQYKMHIFRYKGTAKRAINNSNHNGLSDDTPEEWDLEGMPTKPEWMQIYLKPLAQFEEGKQANGAGDVNTSGVEYLSRDETVVLNLLGLEVRASRYEPITYYMRIIPMMIGFIFVLYGVLLLISMLFDINNTLIPMELVNFVTLGMYKVDKTGDVGYQANFTNEKILNKNRVIVICFVCIAFGIMILTGMFWQLFTSIF